MGGQNRFFARGNLIEKKAAGGTCVFISHQFADLALAIDVGDQLKAIEIDSGLTHKIVQLWKL